MNNEIVKSNGAVATTDVFKKTASSPKAQYHSSDIVIPRIMLVQEKAAFIKQYGATIGDIMNASTGEILAKEGEVINFVPLYYWKTVQKFAVEGMREKFIASLPWVAGKHKEYYAKEDVVMEKRSVDGLERNEKIGHRVIYNFYIMLERDFSTPGELPYLLSFKQTSAAVAKKLVTRLQACDQAGLEYWTNLVGLSSHLKTNKNGQSFESLDVKPLGMIDPIHAGVLRQWSETIIEAQPKVADEESEEIRTVGDDEF